MKRLLRWSCEEHIERKSSFHSERGLHITLASLSVAAIIMMAKSASTSTAQPKLQQLDATPFLAPQLPPHRKNVVRHTHAHTHSLTCDLGKLRCILLGLGEVEVRIRNHQPCQRPLVGLVLP